MVVLIEAASKLHQRCLWKYQSLYAFSSLFLQKHLVILHLNALYLLFGPVPGVAAAA